MPLKKMVHISLLTTIALSVHVLEAQVPVNLFFPGAKLGLANAVTLITLALYGFLPAMFVAVIRSVLGSILLGIFPGVGFVLSLSGAVFATLVMALAGILWRKEMVSLVSVSILGAVAHNTAQVAAASILISTVNLLKLYLPLLLLLAVPTGFATGLAATYVYRALAVILTNNGKEG